MRIQQRGAAALGVVVVMVIAGAVLGDGWVMLLGACGLLFFLLAGVMAWFNLSKLDCRIRTPKRVSAGESFDMELWLQNGRRVMDAFQVEVRLRLPGETKLAVVAPWTAAGSCSYRQQGHVLPRRAFAEQHSVDFLSSFPLGLFRVRRETVVRFEVTVTPRAITPVELNRDGSMFDAQPRGGVTAGQTFGEPRGIRPWQPGDSARRIHWPASARAMARGHDLRVREFDPPGFHPDHCHLVYHSYASGGEMLREDRFERSISLLCGALQLMQANGIPVVLTADFNDWQPVMVDSRAKMVEELMSLAKVERSRGTEAHDLERALQAVAQDHGLVMISDMAPDSWAHLLVPHPHSLVIDIRQIRYRHKTLHAEAASA
ncbi:DUF58 domain-containing protein [Oceaniferula marina]|nr:DUF58 domain-containing protein [Oceaniferula marina]